MQGKPNNKVDQTSKLLGVFKAKTLIHATKYFFDLVCVCFGQKVHISIQFMCFRTYLRPLFHFHTPLTLTVLISAEEEKN